MDGSYPAGLEGFLEDDPTTAAGEGSEDGTVVTEQRSRITIEGSGFPEAAVHIIGFEHDQGDTGHAEPAVVIKGVEDLHPGTVGELPVGGVGAPHLVGLLRREAQVAALRTLVGLRGDEPAGRQDPPHGADRRCVAVALFQVKRDRRRTPLVPVPVKFLTDRHDQGNDLGRRRVRIRPGPSRAGLERGLAFHSVAGE